MLAEHQWEVVGSYEYPTYKQRGVWGSRVMTAKNIKNFGFVATIVDNYSFLIVTGLNNL